jgi:NitT/TauT family transport system ATP-binding protein
VPIDRPRDYEDPRIGQVEAEIVKRVLGVWELEKT